MWAASGCADDEPEDASTTAASTVGMTAGPGSTGSETSSGGTPTDTEPSADASTTAALPDVVYEDDVQPLWNANCTCHLMGSSGTMTAPFLTLNPDISFGQLVGVASEQSALTRVSAGSLEDSYLWRKIEATHEAVGEGTEMPPGVVLEDAELDVIRSWILAGAQP